MKLRRIFATTVSMTDSLSIQELECISSRRQYQATSQVTYLRT